MLQLLKKKKDQAVTATKEFFKPKENVRIRDVAREIPGSIKNTFNNIKTGKLGEGISRSAEQFDFFKPTENVRIRDFVREVPKAMDETAQGFARNIARAGISLYEAPKAISTKRATGNFYNTPFGRINSFQSEAQNRVQRGESATKAIAHGVLDLGLAAGDTMALAKPIAQGLKNLKGKNTVTRELKNIGGDLLDPVRKKIKVPGKVDVIPSHLRKEGFIEKDIRDWSDKLPEGMQWIGKEGLKMEGYNPNGIDMKPRLGREYGQIVPEQRIQRTPDTIKVEGWTPKSKLFRSLQRPGLTVQDVSGGKPPVQSDDVLPLLGKMKQEGLPAGEFTAKTKGEAKKLFKRYKKAPELQITKKTSSQPLFVSPQGDVSKSLNKATQADIASKVPNGDFEDIASPAVGFRDVYRNFERFFKEKAPVMSKRFLEPFEKSKDQMYKNLEKHATDLDTTIVKGLGIKKRSKESKAVQEFGEKTRDYASLVEEFGEEGAKRVATADKWFRSQYDRLIDEVNAVRTRIYPNNPNKIVPKRDDYYRHFREMKEGVAGLQNIFETPAGIDNTLAGISANTKPKSKFASFMQKRLGNKTDVDAVGGFLDYIRSAEYAKNVDPHIENFNRLRQVLAESGNSKNANYNNFLTFLDKFTNDLSGKTNTLDRGVQDVVGRQVFGAVDWLNKRVKSNVILGNASSSIAQIFAVPKGIANAGEKNYVKGLTRLAKSIKNDDAVMRQSPFLRERFSDVFGQFDNRLIQQPKKFAVWMITALDELGTKANWNAFYEKALAEGIENPIRYADDLARKMIGGRGIGEVPMVQKSRLFQLVAPFTLEVVNDWYALSETAKRGTSPLMKALVYTFLFNKVAENLRGSDVAFDPITAVLEGWENAGEEEGIKDKALVFGGRLAGEATSNLPGGAILASAYPEYGNDILPTRKDFFGQGDPTRFGGGVLALNSLSDLYKVLPPFGGNQIKKTLQGAETIAQGYAENNAGNVMYPVEQNPENVAKSLLFGKYSTPEARDYFKEEKKPLGEIQSEIFRATGGSNYDDVMAQRKVDDEKKQALAGVEKVNAGGLNTGSSGEFVELSNGKFFDPITKETFDSPKMAELGRAKSDFKQSDEAFRDLGDIVLRKDADGGVRTQKKTEFTDDLLYRRMIMAKKEEDFVAWNEYAKQKYENLQTMANDPTLDDLEKLNIEDKINTLVKDIAKYGGYGAFTKPKVSSSGSTTERKLTEVERNPYKGLYAYDKKLDRISLPREPRRPAVSLAGNYGGRLRKPQITRIRRKI